MVRLFGILALLILAALGVAVSAAPAAAQDTSAMGRQREGVSTDPVAQPQAPDTSRNLTTREGIETPPGQKAGQQPAQDTGEMADMDADRGGAMPTTGSPLPAIALVGLVTLAVGVGLRLARRA